MPGKYNLRTAQSNNKYTSIQNEVVHIYILKFDSKMETSVNYAYFKSMDTA